MDHELPFEPYRVKVVERIHRVPREERQRLLQAAEYNIFKIPSAAIYVDLLTDSGTSAMSDRQWGALMTGDEAYAQSRSWEDFEGTIQRITGYRHVLPCHQGRAAENLLLGELVQERHVIPNNIHFDTTRANVEFRGAVALDCVCDEGLDPTREAPFKGNMSLTKLGAAFEKYGTHVRTSVYEARDGSLTAVVSIWDTQSAAKTAGDFLAELPDVVARTGDRGEGHAGEESGFGTMGMFYTVVPDYREEFVETFGEVGGMLAEMEGHHDTRLMVNRDDENDMFIASQWRSREDAMGFFRSDAFRDTVQWGREVLADRPRHVFLA